MKKIILCLCVFSYMMADITISGDARFRPRYESVNNGLLNEELEETSDLYYLYRARLNLKADISENWFFNAQIGTPTKSGMTKMGSDPDVLYDRPGDMNSGRPFISFTKLYFGYKSAKRGIWAGVVPLGNSSVFDLHFYPENLVDIPWATYNNNCTTGISGYENFSDYKLDWFISVDQNVQNQFESESLDTSYNNHYTLGFNTTMKFNSMFIKPYFLMSFGNDKVYVEPGNGEMEVENLYSSGYFEGTLPTTFGAEVTLPDNLVENFTVKTSYFKSNYGSPSKTWKEDNNGLINNDADENYYNYEADHLRISLEGPFDKGKIKFFYDIASINYNIEEIIYDEELGEDITEWTRADKLSYIWLSYTQTLYDGEKGSVTVSPTFRLQNGKVFENNDYSKSKFELTTEIKFK